MCFDFFISDLKFSGSKHINKAQIVNKPNLLPKLVTCPNPENKLIELCLFTSMYSSLSFCKKTQIFKFWQNDRNFGIKEIIVQKAMRKKRYP